MTRLNLKKFFFALFYNTSYALNLNISFGILVPFLAYLALNQELTAGILVKSLAAAVLANFFYNSVYVINDRLDYEKDRREMTYKVSAVSRYGIVNYINGYFTACAAILAALFLTGFLDGGRLFLPYLAILSLTSFVHTKFFRIKSWTLFVERWLKTIFPVFLLKSVIGSQPFDDFFTLALLLFPVILHNAYIGALQKKKRQFSHTGVIGMYFLYYCSLLTLFFFGKVMFSYNFFLFAMWYIVIYVGMKATVWAVSRALPMHFLERLYAEDMAEKKEIFSSLLLNSAAILALFAYVLAI